MLFHRDTLAHRSFYYTQTLLHTDVFTHRQFVCTQNTYTTEKLLHTECCLHTRISITHRQLDTGRFKTNAKVTILHQFLTIELHFLRTGLPWRHCQTCNFTSVFSRSNLISCEKVSAAISKTQSYSNFCPIEPHFETKGKHFVDPRWHRPRPKRDKNT